MRMSSLRIVGFALALLLCAVSVSSHPVGKSLLEGPDASWMPALATSLMPVVARQAKKSSAQGENLYREVMGRRSKLAWRNAPANAIPSDVCIILKVCGGEGPKMVTLPRSSEKGRALGRGLFLTKTSSSPSKEAIVLEHQSVVEIYFFLLSPDGKLAKVAYISRGGSWTSMSADLARPIFERDRKAWVEALNKLK